MLKFSARDRLKLFVGAGALALSACGGGSGNNVKAQIGVSPTVVQAPPTPLTPVPAPPTPPEPVKYTEGLLRDTFRNDFKLGAAVSSYQVAEGAKSAELAQSQFSSITPEYQLKPEFLAPTEGVFDFREADALVDWAIANGMVVRGHTLLWHETAPDYFLKGTRDEIKARLETYIKTVVEHFRGRIFVWDVVNEVVSVDLYNGEAGVGPDRRSVWYDAVGNADYIDWAFIAAREADPDALLFINEFDTENNKKRGWLIEIVKRLQSRGVPIDGIGHQMHLNVDAVIPEVLGAIDDVDNQFMGMINHITELDISAYVNSGSCWETKTNCEPDIGPEPPTSLLSYQANMMRELFNGFKARDSVTSVTTWGVMDGDSWLNRVPVQRHNYPLLFDREGNPKPAFYAIVDEHFVIE